MPPATVGRRELRLCPSAPRAAHIQFEVATEGKLLVGGDPVANENFRARAIVRYLDFKPYRDAYFAPGG